MQNKAAKNYVQLFLLVKHIDASKSAVQSSFNMCGIGIIYFFVPYDA
jgi:hypothetical protein